MKSTTRRALSPLLAIAALAALAAPLPADDGAGAYYPTIGQARFTGSGDIAFVDEKVWIYPPDPRSDSLVCQTEFHFRNDGPKAVTVTLLFPVEGEYSEWGVGREDDLRPVETRISAAYGFRTWVDGVETPRRLVPLATGGAGGSNAWAFAMDLGFAPGQTRAVWNHYNFLPKSGWGDSMGNSSTVYEYVLRTGGTWKGPIGKLEVFWAGDTAAYRGFSARKWTYLWVTETAVSPEPGAVETFDGRTWLVWRRSGIKPDFDLVRVSATGPVRIDDSWSLGYGLPMAVVEKYGLLDRPDELERFLQSLANAITDERVWQPGWLATLEASDRAKVEEFARFAINFLYARAGYRFSNPEAAAPFAKRAWYRPRDDFREDLALTMKLEPWLRLRAELARP